MKTKKNIINKRNVFKKLFGNKLLNGKQKTMKSRFWMVVTLLLLVYIVFTQLYEFDINISRKGGTKSRVGQNTASSSELSQTSNTLEELQAEILPKGGAELPITWGDLGKQMVGKGVINADKFRQLFNNKLSKDQEKMLSGEWKGPVKITQNNSRFLLDLFWALGLGNKNKILTEGEMSNKEYGGAGNFASTGGWTLARGDVMDHYSKYPFIKLTTKQQKLVEEVSKGIYRPCCGNSTHFPDCNHGMAMLGLLELMASQGASKNQMYRTALEVNSFWFPQTYIELATYFKEQGQKWSDVDPRLVLGQEYSSGQGYQATRAKIKSIPQPQSGGGGCGV